MLRNCSTFSIVFCSLLQWNPSIAATLGERHFGRYNEVAFVEGFWVLKFLNDNDKFQFENDNHNNIMVIHED